LVGGRGEPKAGPAMVNMPAVTSATAAERNRRFLMKSPPFYACRKFFCIRPAQGQGMPISVQLNVANR
jgi:hypothetical protein